MPFAEVGAEIGRRWRALTPEQKSVSKIVFIVLKVAKLCQMSLLIYNI